jgi:SecD/SecF fusion protein
VDKALKWRIGVVAAVILVFTAFVLPTFIEKMPSWGPRKKINLGLDLKGGIHLIMGVDLEVALDNTRGRLADEVRRALAEAAIVAVNVAKSQDRPLIEAEFPDAASLEEARKLLAKQFSNLAVNVSGLKAELALTPAENTYIREMTGRQALETIRNRVDMFGVAEPDIRPQGDDRIVIQLPGLDDPKRAVALIGKTAMLEFKLVDDARTAEWALQNGLPAGEEVLYGRESGPDGQTQTRPYLLRRQPLMTGEGLVDARVARSGRMGEPEVALTFDSRGARQFERVTGENVQRRMAIVLDGVVYSAPVIQTKIGGGRAVITGSGSPEEARDLAVALRAGALPAPVSVLEERTVGPTLGEDSINMGLKAGGLGLGLILIFMAVYYRRAGLVADAALILNFPIILGALAAFGATLTLPGLFGLVLTLGMAVDANVLIFERIREELRAGKTPKAAVAAGFDRAFWTIFDSNLTSILTALILYQFGTGPIRGFAVTLTIGLLSSMFTAIFFSRLVFDLALNRRPPEAGGLSIGRLEIVKPGVSLNFIGHRHKTLALSAILILISLVSIGTKGLVLGIDFAGGVLIQPRFTETVSSDDIRTALTRAGLPEARIQTYGTPAENEFLIDLKGDNDALEGSAGHGRPSAGLQAGEALTDHFGADRVDIRRVEMVGPQVGRDLRGKALSAMFYSLLMVLIYISGRFEHKWGTSAVFVTVLLGACYAASLLGANLMVMNLVTLATTLILCYLLNFQYALGAILALLHDVIITVGAFSLLGKEISLSFVAAILTIIGFSLNDTIIIFDRIREHIARNRRFDYAATINRSLNETLSRTVLTSGTTILATLSIYLFGGQANRDFALALLIGFIVGTLSSIVVAAPTLLFWPQPGGGLGEKPKEPAPKKPVDAPAGAGRTAPA